MQIICLLYFSHYIPTLLIPIFFFLINEIRLRHLAQKQVELSNGIDTEHVKVSSEHLDHHNPHTFEMEDLKKLIAKVSSDLNEADEKRRKEFKEYEMQKEYEKQQKLQHLSGSEREAFEKQIKENETKHKQHEPVSQKTKKKFQYYYYYYFIPECYVKMLLAIITFRLMIKVCLSCFSYTNLEANNNWKKFGKSKTTWKIKNLIQKFSFNFMVRL